MIGFQEASAILFILSLIVFLYFKREKLAFQSFLFPLFYIAMYRTKIGINLMEKVSKKFEKFLKPLCWLIIFVGFTGMILIVLELVKSSYNLITKTDMPPGVGIIQPFAADVPGTVFVPFFYFIISIFIIAVVHEFSHGVIARLHDMKVKSSGFAVAGFIFPIIPAAFVEPDEKQVRARPLFQQLSMYAAGPFANVVTAFGVLIIISFFVAPVSDAMLEFKGLDIKSFSEESSAKEAGMSVGEIITIIDGKEVESRDSFSKLLEMKSPGEEVRVSTYEREYDFAIGSNPNNPEKAFLGVVVSPKMEYRQSFIEKYGKVVADTLSWFFQLLYWIFVLNLGVGLFNLVPIGPIDGGRMLFAVCKKYFKETSAASIASSVSLGILMLLFFNIFSAFFI